MKVVNVSMSETRYRLKAAQTYNTAIKNSLSGQESLWNVVPSAYIVLFFAKGADDCERARARSYQRRKLNLNENHFLGKIHVTKLSVREIDRCEKNASSFFFLSGKKTTFYFRYSTNHSSRQILDNILWSPACGHELFSTDVCLSRYVNNCWIIRKKMIHKLSYS